MNRPQRIAAGVFAAFLFLLSPMAASSDSEWIAFISLLAAMSLTLLAMKSDKP